MNQVHLKLGIIEQHRFKKWFNPKYLAYFDREKDKLYRDFKAYLRLYEDLIEAGDDSRKNGHAGKTALMSTCNAVLDGASPHPQHTQIIEALMGFIEHTKQHEHTPIWAEMRAVAEQYHEEFKWG
jgi:hypothetical protein